MPTPRFCCRSDQPLAVEFNGLPVADVCLTADNVKRTEVRINLRHDQILDTVNHVRIYF